MSVTTQENTPSLIDMDPVVRNEVRIAIRSMLSEPIKFDEDDNLIELGLDSLKIMRLVNEWRRAGSLITFADLIEAPYLGDWLQLLQKNKGIPLADKKIVGTKIKADKKESFPLTDVQYAYWIGRRDGQPLGGVGCHAYLEIDGSGVDPERLDFSWKKILKHHPMLRAKFLPDGHQKILDMPLTQDLVVNDLRHCLESDLELELKEIRNRLSHRRLSVEDGEVAGLELSLLPAGKTKLHFDIDLLAADVQSLQIILRDLAASYGIGRTPVASPEWDFSSYLKREKQRLEIDREKDKLYWTERLPTLSGAPGLPLKQKPETITQPIFTRRTYVVKNDDWAILKKRAANHKVTPSMVLLTIYAEVLDRWSDKSQFLINLPLFDRQTGYDGIEDVVADFTNLLLLTIDCREKQSFAKRVKSIQKQFHKDVAHSAYSGVQVQRDMTSDRQGARMIAPVVFACNLGTPLINDECRETLGTLAYMISQTPQIWLDFQVYEIDDGLLLAWDVVDDLFPDGLIDSMFSAYTQLIGWLVDSNDNWQSSFDLLPISQQKVRNENIALSVPETTLCLHSAFFNYAESNPQQTALIWSHSNATTSYGELAKRALQVAAYLEKQGVVQGDPVAVTMPRGIEQIVAILGILSLGACYVPVSIDQPDVRRERIHKTAKINFAITNFKEQSEAPKWPDGTTVINITDTRNISTLQEPVQLAPEQVAYIIFTSGSTGEPKGVEICHGAAWNTIETINLQYQINQNDRVLAVSAIDFDLSVYDIFGLLSVGGSLVLISEEVRRDAAYWFQAINKYHISIWNSVPVLLDMLLIVAEGKQQQKLPLRQAMLSGDWIGLDLPQRLNDVTEQCQLVAMGGATEASIWSNYYDVTIPLPEYWSSIPYGKALASQAYRVVNSKGDDCPDWVTGELWIGGTGVARGYCGDAELTKKRFVEWKNSRWYKTGDLGRFLANGNIEFLGREDCQVKIRGHRIELGEIEFALCQAPEVTHAIVVTKDNPPVLAAAVILEKDAVDMTVERAKVLQTFLTSTLPSHMIPNTFTVMDEFPLNVNGKIDRSAILRQLNQKKTSERSSAPPRNELERQVTDIWTEILQIEELSINENYFSLGGDSLKATRIIEQLHLHHIAPKEISLETLFLAPTVGSLTERIRQATTQQAVEDDSAHLEFEEGVI